MDKHRLLCVDLTEQLGTRVFGFKWLDHANEIRALFRGHFNNGKVRIGTISGGVCRGRDWVVENPIGQVTYGDFDGLWLSFDCVLVKEQREA